MNQGYVSGPRQARTVDPRIKSPLLYRLSYRPHLLRVHILRHRKGASSPDFVDLRLEKVGALNHLAHAINAIFDGYPSCKSNALESIEDGIVIIEPFANNAMLRVAI